MLKSEFLFLLHKDNLYEDIKSLSKIRLFMFHNCTESSLGISIFKSLGGGGQLGTSSFGILYTLLFLPSLVVIILYIKIKRLKRNNFLQFVSTYIWKLSVLCLVSSV